MNDPFDLAHNLAKSLAPFNHLVVAATDQAYLIGRLQGEVKEILFDLDEAIKQRDEARRQVCRQMLLRGVVFQRVGAASVAVTEPSDVAKMMDWNCFE